MCWRTSDKQAGHGREAGHPYSSFCSLFSTACHWTCRDTQNTEVHITVTTSSALSYWNVHLSPGGGASGLCDGVSHSSLLLLQWICPCYCVMFLPMCWITLWIPTQLMLLAEHYSESWPRLGWGGKRHSPWAQNRRGTRQGSWCDYHLNAVISKNQNECKRFHDEQNTKMLNKDKIPTGLRFGG